jgi:predicted DNA-binding protein with PD1-like motif
MRDTPLRRYPPFVIRALAVAALLLLVACGTTAPSRTPEGSGRETRAFAFRLGPGADLRKELEAFAASRGLQAAYVATCVGSVRVASIRFADQKDATVLTGPFEIVSLTGTLSPDGPHLHVSVSDSTGRTIGGHLSEGTLVYTTAEVVVVELAGARFSRAIDPATTFKELVVE